MRETSSYDAAPTGFLDQLEEQRMDLSDEKLIAEAIEINHAGVGKDKTLDRYQAHLIHFSQYLASMHGKTLYSCRSKHVRLFMGHLAVPGGPSPHPSRLTCEWCRARGYPDGRSRHGWSPSYRKSYLAAIRFLYRHFLVEEDLPDHNPAALEISPRVVVKHGYTPTRAEIKKLLPGKDPQRQFNANPRISLDQRGSGARVAEQHDLLVRKLKARLVGRGSVSIRANTVSPRCSIASRREPIVSE